ncbi:hypothetical protein [uncultured Litoreibacter sp.]|uniref:hypothetical protein n=1 Tax=uncultured Litoreibacter sp. TaxID=1392394 RepID=UPI00262E915B|nr:hypothetical protein [uncultured Litoreibacter sp.]
MRFQLSIFGRLLTTLALIIAFASSGFTHNNGQSPQSPELALYLANGGVLSDICGANGDPNQPHLVKCETCRLNASMIDVGHSSCLPEVVTGQTRKLSFVAKLLRNSTSLDPNRLSRAPPLQA